MEMAAAGPQQSLFAWYLRSLGLFGMVSITGTALLAFVLTILILVRGRGPLAGATLVLCALAPLMVGLLMGLNGAISAFSIIATSEVSPKPAELANGISQTLLSPQVALLLSAPTWCVGILGGLIRSFLDRETQPVAKT